MSPTIEGSQHRRLRHADPTGRYAQRQAWVRQTRAAVTHRGRADRSRPHALGRLGQADVAFDGELKQRTVLTACQSGGAREGARWSGRCRHHKRARASKTNLTPEFAVNSSCYLQLANQSGVGLRQSLGSLQ